MRYKVALFATFSFGFTIDPLCGYVLLLFVRADFVCLVDDVNELIRKDDYMVDFDTIKDASVRIHHGSDAPVSIEGSVVRAEWCDLNEGLCGEYNPKDPEDICTLAWWKN